MKILGFTEWLDSSAVNSLIDIKGVSNRGRVAWLRTMADI